MAAVRQHCFAVALRDQGEQISSFLATAYAAEEFVDLNAFVVVLCFDPVDDHGLEMQLATMGFDLEIFRSTVVERD